MEKDSSRLTNKLIIGEGIAILCAMLTCFAWLHGQMTYVNERVDAVNVRTDQLYSSLQETICAQNARSDQLYSELIEMKKEQK